MTKYGIQVIYNINLYKFCSYKLVEVLLQFLLDSRYSRKILYYNDSYKDY